MKINHKKIFKTVGIVVLVGLVGFAIYFYAIIYGGNITHQKEIQFAKSTLILTLENDKPNKKWIDAIGGREANSSEMMFYFLKVWFIENGVTKDDLASAYINTPILKHGDISEFDLNYKKDKPYIRVATLDTKEGQKLEFSFPMDNCLFSGDYNNDGRIDSLDVILAKKTKK